MDQANETHLAPWLAMLKQHKISVTPLSPYLHKQLLQHNHLNIDGSAIEAAGFKYAVPECTMEGVRDSIVAHMVQGIFPVCLHTPGSWVELLRLPDSPAMRTASALLSLCLFNHCSPSCQVWPVLQQLVQAHKRPIMRWKCHSCEQRSDCASARLTLPRARMYALSSSSAQHSSAQYSTHTHHLRVHEMSGLDVPPYTICTPGRHNTIPWRRVLASHMWRARHRRARHVLAPCLPMMCCPQHAWMRQPHALWLCDLCTCTTRTHAKRAAHRAAPAFGSSSPSACHTPTCRSLGLVDTPAGQARRAAVCAALDIVLRAYLSATLASSASSEAGSRMQDAWQRVHPLLTFGSYRQGVHSPHSDIDALAMVPDAISREEFFHAFPLFLTHIAAVTQVRALPLAAVPVINLYMDGIAVDLLLARYHPAASVAAHAHDVNIPADDVKSQLSYGGVQVTDAILAAITDAANAVGLTADASASVARVRPDTLSSYRCALVTLKAWARARGLYGNMFGYLGGVSWAILTARCAVVQPTWSPWRLLRAVFFSLARAREGDSLHLGVPTPASLAAARRCKATEALRIFTPASPSMNSAHNVCAHTLRILQSEATRALNIMTRATRQLHRASSDVDAEATVTCALADVCTPFPLRGTFAAYLIVSFSTTAVISSASRAAQEQPPVAAPAVVTVQSEEDAAQYASAWVGWCESRLRTFAQALNQTATLTPAPRSACRTAAPGGGGSDGASIARLHALCRLFPFPWTSNAGAMLLRPLADCEDSTMTSLTRPQQLLYTHRVHYVLGVRHAPASLHEPSPPVGATEVAPVALHRRTPSTPLPCAPTNVGSSETASVSAAVAAPAAFDGDSGSDMDIDDMTTQDNVFHPPLPPPPPLPTAPPPVLPAAAAAAATATARGGSMQVANSAPAAAVAGKRSVKWASAGEEEASAAVGECDMVLDISAALQSYADALCAWSQWQPGMDVSCNVLNTPSMEAWLAAHSCAQDAATVAAHGGRVDDETMEVDE